MAKKKAKAPSRAKKGSSSYENSAVSRLRVITGLSEVEFADRCALQLRAYKSLVSRQHKKRNGVSYQSAFQISAVTGASASMLVENRLISIFTNNAYTADDYEHYLHISRAIKYDWKKLLIEAVAQRFHDNMKSLMNKKGANFLPTVIAMAAQVDSFGERYGTFVSDFGLTPRPSIQPGIEQVARDIRSKSPKGYQYKLDDSIESDLVRLLEHIVASDGASQMS